MTQDVYMGRRAVDEAAAAALESVDTGQEPKGDDAQPALFAVG